MSSAAKVWAVIKPHVPMIRFRKGGKLSHSVSSTAAGAANVVKATGKKNMAESITANILPKRYSRKPITDLEMDAIQMGGMKAL